MNTFEPRVLPKALEKLLAFNDLGALERAGFGGLMARADQVSKNALRDLMAPNSSAIDVLNSMECDALSLSSHSSPPSIANWVIHDSWHTSLNKLNLLPTLHPSVRAAIERYPPDLSSSEDHVEMWIRLQVRALIESIDAFYSSLTPEAALANKWSMDIILGLLATYSTTIRFRW